MSEVNSGKIKCRKCKAEADVVLNRSGNPCKMCEKCLDYHKEYNKWWLANESIENHAARMKTMGDKYRFDEVYRERKIKAATLFSPHLFETNEERKFVASYENL